MKAKVQIQEDRCPMCGGAGLDYYDKEWHGDMFSQEVTCAACEFEFQQWYSVKFDGMTIRSDMDGQSHEDIE